MTQQPKDLEALLISKAMADEAFKSELISNPKAVIAREIGQELPEGVEIEVLEPTRKKLYLVLPLKVESGEMPSDELSNEQLDAVAGGKPYDCDTHPLICRSSGGKTWSCNRSL
jgi:hypothetical protein